MKDLNYDIVAMLQSPDNGGSDILEKFAASCQEFRSRVAASVESYLNHEKGKLVRSLSCLKLLLENLLFVVSIFIEYL